MTKFSVKHIISGIIIAVIILLTQLYLYTQQVEETALEAKQVIQNLVTTVHEKDSLLSDLQYEYNRCDASRGLPDFSKLRNHDIRLREMDYIELWIDGTKIAYFDNKNFNYSEHCSGKQYIQIDIKW